MSFASPGIGYFLKNVMKYTIPQIKIGIPAKNCAKEPNRSSPERFQYSVKNIAKAKKTPIKNILGNFRMNDNTLKITSGINANTSAILVPGGTVELITPVHTKIKNTTVMIMKEVIAIPKINVFFFLLGENLT